MIEILLFMAGLAAGIINTVAGGGIVLVFGALLAGGLSPLLAATTSNLAIGPGIVTAAYGYRKDIRKAKRYYSIVAVPAVTGGLIGAVLLVRTPSHIFEQLAPWLILFSVTIFSCQPWLHRHIRKPSHKRSKIPHLALISSSFIIGIYGGYFGAGFGFLLLALLGFTHLKNFYQITGLKNLVASGIILLSSTIYIMSDKIAWEYLFAPMLGGIIGGLIGTRIGHRTSPHVTRAIVISSGLTLCALMLSGVI